MNSRYQGPAIFPPANETRKRIEAHLDQVPSKAGSSNPVLKKWSDKLRWPRPRP